MKLREMATLFRPGTYGTFISWCIYSFSTLNTKGIINPIDEQASAHLFRKSIGLYVVMPTHRPAPGIENYVILDYDQSRAINYYNNQLDKQSLGDEHTQIEAMLPDYHTKLLTNWNTTDRWAVREMLSLVFDELPQHQYNINRQHTAEFINYTCYHVLPEQFLANPVTELEKIYDCFKLDKHAEFNLVTDYVELYLSKQRYYNRHIELNEFISAVINERPLELASATIFDEAYIQTMLAKQGYRLKCAGLNNFPLNAQDLARILDK